MHRRAEHIHARDLLHPISALDQHIQIPCETRRLAGDIDHMVDTVRNDFRQSLWVDAVARWIEDDEIRFLRNVVEHLEYIACDKTAIGKSVARGIFTCSHDCLLYNLDSNDFLCHGCKDLGNCTGTGIQVKNGLILRISDILTRSTVEYLRTEGLGLKKENGVILKRSPRMVS